MHRENILTALVGKTIGGITMDRRGGLVIWGTDPRDGALMTIAADSTFDRNGNYFDLSEVKPDGMR